MSWCYVGPSKNLGAGIRISDDCSERMSYNKQQQTFADAGRFNHRSRYNGGDGGWQQRDSLCGTGHVDLLWSFNENPPTLVGGGAPWESTGDGL
jgi:hypothetical protein